MPEPPPHPPLKPLHPEASLSEVKLSELKRVSTEEIERTLKPGSKDSLKVRPGGTILDGHHRSSLLRFRGIDVNALPREIIVHEEL